MEVRQWDQAQSPWWGLKEQVPLKMGVWGQKSYKVSDFCHMMLCISAVFPVVWWLGVLSRSHTVLKLLKIQPQLL